jgi:nicotinamidase-related amidase
MTMENIMNINARFLKSQEALLLIVDIQKVMFDLCVEKNKIKKNIDALIELATNLEIPIIFTEHNAEKLGGFELSLSQKSPKSPVLNKLEFSCFGNDQIRKAITKAAKKTIILAGIESHICIFQTGAQAIQEGFNVHTVTDAISARTSFNLNLGINRLKQAGAVITSTEMLIFELILKAGTHDFKKMLPIIKNL